MFFSSAAEDTFLEKFYVFFIELDAAGSIVSKKRGDAGISTTRLVKNGGNSVLFGIRRLDKMMPEDLVRDFFLRYNGGE